MFVHLMKAPSTMSSVEQRGQVVGAETFVLVGNDSENAVPSECILPDRSSSSAGPITSVIFGITSPRLTTLTLSPTIIPRRSTSPLLWSVVFSTVTPETTTGATLDTGVTFPVLPVCQNTSISTVDASSGGNFHAKAQRGWCAVSPRRFLLSSLSSFTTTPSISHSAESRDWNHSLVTSRMAFAVDWSSSPETTLFPATSIPISLIQEMTSESSLKSGGPGLSGCRA